MTDSFDQASSLLNARLTGAVFDSFMVYTDSSQLRFASRSEHGETALWLTETALLTLRTKDATHTRRSHVMAYLHALLGQSVRQVELRPAGVLHVHLGGGLLTVEPDQVNLERIWSFTPDTPELSSRKSAHAWKVFVNDDREVHVERA